MLKCVISRQLKTTKSTNYRLTTQRSIHRYHSSSSSSSNQNTNTYNHSSSSSNRSIQSETANYLFQTYVACKGKKNDNKQNINSNAIAAAPDQCGEDSFFLAPDEQTFGIADGVGGWNEKNVDPSQISRSLMLNAQVHATCDRKPQAILKIAYELTMKDPNVEAGSTTACIIQFSEDSKGRPVLIYANLGDSGFAIIRGQDVVFRSEFQNYGAAPYQLAKVPARFKGEGNIESQPEEADCGKFVLQDGDIVVLGTDGVWDNFAPDLHQHGSFLPPLRKWFYHWHGAIESFTTILNTKGDMASNILDASLRHNLKPDDITVLVTQVSCK